MIQVLRLSAEDVRDEEKLQAFVRRLNELEEEGFAMDVIPNLMWSVTPDGAVLGTMQYAYPDPVARTIRPLKLSEFVKRQERVARTARLVQ